jgi:hypothetical protein
MGSSKNSGYVAESQNVMRLKEDFWTVQSPFVKKRLRLA